MKKLAIKCVWLSPKRNFLKKVAFWAQAKHTSKTRFIYGPLRSINENALLRVFGLLLLVCAFTKMSLIYLTDTQTQTHQFSHTDPHLFALHAACPHPHASQLRLISALCSAFYSVVSFFLFFFFLSSSSSTRFWFFFFFNFISV